MAFNLNTVPPLDLLGDMRGLYNSHEVLSYREWHDGFIFERLFNIYGGPWFGGKFETMQFAQDWEDEKLLYRNTINETRPTKMVTY